MRIKNITVFLSFFLSFPEFILVIRYFVWGSQFSCGSWQDCRDHRPTHHPAHAGFRPRTTMNHFYMNDDAIGRFSFSAPLLRPSTGISASFSIFCMLSRAGRHIFVDCCVLTGELTFFGLFFLFYRSNDFHFMFSFLRHSSGFFAPF